MTDIGWAIKSLKKPRAKVRVILEALVLNALAIGVFADDRNFKKRVKNQFGIKL